MNAGTGRRPRGGVLGLIVLLWLGVFSLACHLPLTGARAPGHAADTVVGQWMGASRVGVGQSFVDRADSYFHLGAEPPPARAFTDFLQRWADEIRPKGHAHPAGTSVAEIMPWLRGATELDPHNVEAYLNASFWLAGQTGRPDLAMDVMVEAQRNNPRDYRVYAEKGRVYLLLHEDRRAAGALEAGLRLWPAPHDGHDEEDRLELGRLLSLRAFVHEVQGERNQALRLFRQAASLFPANVAVRHSIQVLESGQDVQAWARDALQNLFPTRVLCGREAAGEPHHHHDGEDAPEAPAAAPAPTRH